MSKVKKLTKGQQRRIKANHDKKLKSPKDNAKEKIQGDEYDIVLSNGTSIMVVSVKTNLNVNHIYKLVEKELVDRKQGTKDRRKVMVSIKAKGMDLLKSLDQPMIDMMNSYSNIEEKDARKLNELLDKLREQ